MTEETSAPEVQEVQEVFGQFAVAIATGVELFLTEAEALTALSEFKNGAANLQIATDYAASQGLDGKNARTKVNVVLSFLTWVDAGSPEAAAPAEAGDDSTEAGSDDGSEPAAAGGEVTF